MIAQHVQYSCCDDITACAWAGCLCFSGIACIISAFIILGVNTWAIEAQSWPEVEGTITSSEMIYGGYNGRWCQFYAEYTPSLADSEESKIFQTMVCSFRVGDKGYGCDPGGDIMIKYNPSDPAIAEASDSLDTRISSVIAAWVLFEAAGAALVACCFLVQSWE